MRLRMNLLLVGLLTGVLLETVQAGEPPPGDCPPPSPGEPQFMPAPGGPPTFDGRAPAPHRGLRMHMPLAEFDLDRDGRISRAEIDRALKARFEEADSNHDGKLDEEEFDRARPAPPDGPPPFERAMSPRRPGQECDAPDGPIAGPGDSWPDAPGPGDRRSPPNPREIFKHLDWNLDGELSFEEFSAPIHQMALDLDRNGDGVIDADEMKSPVMPFGSGFGPPPGLPPEPPRDR